MIKKRTKKSVISAERKALLKVGKIFSPHSKKRKGKFKSIAGSI